MNASKNMKPNQAIESGMKKPLIFSVLFHLAIIILATFGLPYIIKKPEVQEMAMTVEIADLAAVSETNVVDKPNESKEEAPEPPKPVEQKPVYQKEPEPEPEPVKEPVPDLLTPQKPEVEEVPEPPEEKPPEEEKVAEVKKPPKPVNKPKPPKPKVEKPKEEPKKEEPKEPEKDFSSLLKSLTPDQEEAQKPVQAPDQNQSEQSQTSQLANAGANLTRSEEDDLNRGVQPCWNLNAGGKYAEDLIVSLRVFVNPDMSVRDVQVLDQGRMSSDPHFRTAAEAARRALLNPNCRTLKLPPEKYEHWKVFKYNFDPSMML